MKRASEYARELRQLYHTLLRRHGRPRTPALREPIYERVYAVLARNAPESRAMAAAENLRRALPDLNELRVTPVIELADLIGDGFPNAYRSAESLARVLNGL